MSSTISALNSAQIAAPQLRIQNSSSRTSAYTCADMNAKKLHTIQRGSVNPLKNMDRSNFKDQAVRIQDGKQSFLQKSSQSFTQSSAQTSGQESRYRNLTQAQKVDYQGQQMKNAPVFFDHPFKNLQNILSSQKSVQNQKAGLNEDVQFSIMNQNPINAMGGFMDRAFGQGSQAPTMLNKMVGRAFATVVLPIALCAGNPSLAATASPAMQVDPTIQLNEPTMIQNVSVKTPEGIKTFKSFPTSSLVLGSTTPAFLDSTIDQLNKWDNNGEVDLARDTGLRYLGYANETGESFKFIAPQFLTPSYALAYGYCLGDGLYKGLHYFYDHDAQMSSGVIKAFGDALIFQCFASVLIPGNIIAWFVETSDEKIKESESLKDNEALVKWGPTFIGLGTIPFIVHPIDVSVDWVMEHSIRLLYQFF